MAEIARSIRTRRPADGQVVVYWLAGAGFVLKTARMTIGIDLYLSNACQSAAGFKRIYPSPVTADELELDLLIATHDHGDHLDAGSIVEFALAGTLILGPGSVVQACRQRGLSDERLIELNRGRETGFGDLTIEAVEADHGDLSPDCIGVVLSLNDKRIYYASDTCPRFDVIDQVKANGPVDLYLVPINGRYGNPDSLQAIEMTRRLAPRIVVPCHFWMFIEHGSEPWIFVESAGRSCPETQVRMLQVGEPLMV
jgi:L-ascorbate 6-phosphate lactonase